MVVLWIISEGRNLGLGNHTSFLCQDIAKGACHSQSRVRLVEHPDTRWAKLLVCLWSSYGPLTLNALDYESLRESIINLPLIMIYTTVSFIRHIWLMVASLR